MFSPTVITNLTKNLKNPNNGSPMQGAASGLVKAMTGVNSGYSSGGIQGAVTGAINRLEGGQGIPVQQGSTFVFGNSPVGVQQQTGDSIGAGALNGGLVGNGMTSPQAQQQSIQPQQQPQQQFYHPLWSYYNNQPRQINQQYQNPYATAMTNAYRNYYNSGNAQTGQRIPQYNWMQSRPFMFNK